VVTARDMRKGGVFTKQPPTLPARRWLARRFAAGRRTPLGSPNPPSFRPETCYP